MKERSREKEKERKEKEKERREKEKERKKVPSHVKEMMQRKSQGKRKQTGCCDKGDERKRRIERQREERRQREREKKERKKERKKTKRAISLMETAIAANVTPSLSIFLKLQQNYFLSFFRSFIERQKCETKGKIPLKHSR